MNSILGVPIVLAATLTLFIAVQWVKRRFSPPAEWTRKLIHVGVGSIALTFPWVLGSKWAVVTVCSIGAAGLALVRRSKRMGGQLQGLVGVERVTWGEVCFPVTVALLFLMASENTVLYIIPLLILTFADAAAAIVGLHYGLLRYATGEGQKSTEGSLVFFAVAFFATHIPLLLFTGTGRAESLLIALLVALLGMMMEAVSARGLDNIVMPLLTLLILKASLDRPTLELTLEVAVACGLLGFLIATRRRSTLSGSALLGVGLVGYLTWAFGGWQWMLAPGIMFLVNAFQFTHAGTRGVPVHFGVVLRVSGAGLAWMYLATALNRHELMVPFVFAFTAQLAMLSVRHLRIRLHAFHEATIVAASTTIAWLCLFLPFAALGTFEGMEFSAGVSSYVAALLAARLFHRRLMVTLSVPAAPLPWREQGTYGALASLAGLLPLYVF